MKANGYIAEKLQYLKQHYEKKITNYLINNDKFKSEMSVQDELIQQLENKLNTINLESKGQCDHNIKVRIVDLKNQVEQLLKDNEIMTKDNTEYLMQLGKELNDLKDNLREEQLLKENLVMLLKASDEENHLLREQKLVNNDSAND